MRFHWDIVSPTLLRHRLDSRPTSKQEALGCTVSPIPVSHPTSTEPNPASTTAPQTAFPLVPSSGADLCSTSRRHCAAALPSAADSACASARRIASAGGSSSARQMPSNGSAATIAAPLPDSLRAAASRLNWPCGTSTAATATATAMALCKGGGADTAAQRVATSNPALGSSASAKSDGVSTAMSVSTATAHASAHAAGESDRAVSGRCAGCAHAQRKVGHARIARCTNGCGRAAARDSESGTLADGSSACRRICVLRSTLLRANAGDAGGSGQMRRCVTSRGTSALPAQAASRRRTVHGRCNMSDRGMPVTRCNALP